MEKLTREILLMYGFFERSPNVFFKKGVSASENVLVINVHHDNEGRLKYTTTFCADLYTVEDLKSVWFLMNRQFLTKS